MRKYLFIGSGLGILLFACLLFLWSRSAVGAKNAVVVPIQSAAGDLVASMVRPTPTFMPQPASRESVRSDHSWIATVSADRVRRIVATGDVIPARSVNSQTVKRGGDFTWAWKEIAPVLKKGDIAVINLESPLVSGCPVTEEGMVFCGDPRHIDGLKYAGVKVATVANNHFGNYGLSGITGTEKLIEDAGIAVAGLGKPAVREIRGMKFAFLAFNDIGVAPQPIASADADAVVRAVGDAKKEADIVVTAFHWGIEYTATPSARQVYLAHAAVDAGSDLVLGNHPHWVEPAEIYKGRWITYAHGNTIFDQMWSEETKIGVIGIYTFVDRTLSDVEFIPIRIAGYGQPTLLTGSSKDSVLRMMAIP